MADLSTMRTALRRKLGNPSTTSVADSILTEHINSAYKHIATRYRFKITRERERFNTVASTQAYSLSGQYAVVYQVWDRTHNVKLYKRGVRDVVALDLSVSNPTDDEGIPTSYVTWGNSIELYPIPDAVYAMEAIYKKIPAALSANGDTPIIPDTWHDGIVFLARWYYWDDLGDGAKSQIAYNSWKLWLSDKPNEMDEEEYDNDDVGVVMPHIAPSTAALDFEHGG